MARNEHRPWYTSRWVTIPAAVIVALLIVAHIAGGWYFSSEIGDDVFTVSPGGRDFDLEVVRADGSSVTLIDPEGDDEELVTEGVFGLEWDGGYGQLGRILEQGGNQVVRELLLITGELPAQGSKADVQGQAYPSDPLSALGVAFEDVTYESPLGEMDAWFIPGTSDRWVIMVHGKGASRAETIRATTTVVDAGHPVLAITYRNDPGQPADRSGYYRYGISERLDLEAAVVYALGQGAGDVVLMGFSTGAAIAVGFMDSSPQADAVAGLVFDAPNLDLGAVVDEGASHRSIPGTGLSIPGYVVGMAKFIAELRYDIDFDDVNYLDRAAEIAAPILVFHGTEDETVPIEVSRKLFIRRIETDVVEVVGAGHVQSWNVDRDRYESTLRGFLANLA